jgi:hypothetical protein
VPKDSRQSSSVTWCRPPPRSDPREVAADFDIFVDSVRRVPAGRHRRRLGGCSDQRRAGRARAAAPREATAGDGEQDPAPRCGLLRRRQPPTMSYPLVRDLAAEGIPVRLTCGVLGHSSRAYYASLAGAREPARSRGRLPDEHPDRRPPRRPRVRLPVPPRRARAARAGRRRAAGLAAVLAAETVLHHCAKAVTAAGKTPGPAVHDDLVRRDFTRSGRTRCGSPTSSATRRSRTERRWKGAATGSSQRVGRS